MGLDFVSVHADDPILSGGGVLVCAQAGGTDLQPTLPLHRPPAFSPHTIQHSDLLLWDSRTVHCNTPAPSQARAHQPSAALFSHLTLFSIASQSHFFSLPEEEQRQQAAAQPRELIRLCSYVCMVPRAHATAEELRIKVKMFASRCENTAL
jgi:hypothetical protein